MREELPDPRLPSKISWWLEAEIEYQMRAILNPRSRSLARGNILVLASLVIALLISHPPFMRATLFLVLPMLGVLWGTVDTMRCMQRRWNLYHGGVILCIYMDLLTITLVGFFLIYPYFLWFSETR